MADTSLFMISLFEDARNDLSCALRHLSKPSPDYLEAILSLCSASQEIAYLISYCSIKSMEDDESCE